jgi:glyoxylase-like metal-dependent hydrolase (beta-lactamase superfamily II)
MSIRILNCVTMAPRISRRSLGGPCLVLECDEGLVLVDTGLGLHDYLQPSRMVRFFKARFGIPDDPEQAAVCQLARLGYSPGDVRHIVLTHLHFDHAGGLPDFPAAQVHVHRREYEAMRKPRQVMAVAYDALDFAHQPDWKLYDQPTGQWQDLEAIRLPIAPEMYLVPLFGHTAGHCGVAIRDGDGWLFQCADALPSHARFDLLPDWLSRVAFGPHVPRLRAWSAAHPQVRILAGHMRQSFFEDCPM